MRRLILIEDEPLGTEKCAKSEIYIYFNYTYPPRFYYRARTYIIDRTLTDKL